jgi:CheY-like chemotaxis protein
MPSQSPLPARILLVDNNTNGLKARKAVLEEHGYSITLAGGDDALAQFSKQKFDLVITGRRMTRADDGLELISGLREASPNVPIILISGYANTLGLTEANTGADAVIQKSANEVTHLVRTVARLLRSKPTRKPPSPATPPSPTSKKRKMG